MHGTTEDSHVHSKLSIQPCYTDDTRSSAVTRTVQSDRSRRTRLPFTARPHALLAALSPASLWLRPMTLLSIDAAEARSVCSVRPAPSTVQSARITARLLQPRDGRGTSRQWREAQRPSPSPHHEAQHGGEIPRVHAGFHTGYCVKRLRCIHLQSLHVRNVHFPLLGFEPRRVPQGEHSSPYWGLDRKARDLLETPACALETPPSLPYTNHT